MTIFAWLAFAVGFALGLCSGAALDMLWWLDRERRFLAKYSGGTSPRRKRPF